MKNRYSNLALITLTMTSATNALGDFTLVSSVAYQDKELSFDQKYSGAANNDADFSVNLPMLTASLTAAYGKFFASIKMERNLADTSTNTTETNRAEEDLTSNLITHEGGTVDVGREDITLTVGMNVWKSLNLFVGYLDGKTELSPDPFCANPFPPSNDDGFFEAGDPALVACSRSNRAFQQFFIGDTPSAENPPFFYVENQPAYQQEYTESGFYFGTSYTFKVAEAGNLSVSIAYASMDGEYKDNANDPEGAFSNFVAFDYEGDTTGTSIGLTWSAGLGESSAYFVDVRRQSYSMTGSDQTGRFEGVSLRTDEEMTGITGGVQFYF